MNAKRVAATVAMGLLLHLVFSNVGSDYDLAFTYWMAYALVCAMILNYDERISTSTLALMSLPSPMVVVLATYYRALFQGVNSCWLSGQACELNAGFVYRGLAFVAASVVSIWIFAHMSSWVIGGIGKVFNLSPAKAKAIRSRIVWIGTFLLAVFGVFQIIAHGWRR